MPPDNNFPAKACPDYTEAELIAMILAGGEAANRAMKCLHDRYFDQARLSLQRHRLDRDSVIEAYDNALLALRDQIRAGKFRGEGSLKAFFAKIFKFKVIDELRRSTTNKADDPELRATLEQEMATLTPEELLLLDEEQSEQTQTEQRRKACMDKALAVFSERDKAMLVDYFILELPLAEIVKKYQFKTPQSASSTLSRLKKELMIEIALLCKNEPGCQLLCPGGRRPNQPS